MIKREGEEFERKTLGGKHRKRDTERGALKWVTHREGEIFKREILRLKYWDWNTHRERNTERYWEREIHWDRDRERES